MVKLAKPIVIETTFDTYVLNEKIGEGGAGQVFGGISGSNEAVAVKVLNKGAPTETRRRFKNETAFLRKDVHPNIVAVLDHGLAKAAGVEGPFYVMHRYHGSLRDVIKSGVKPDQAVKIFAKILEGVEAAHLLKVKHRDLKPENILCSGADGDLAVADFGIAEFTGEMLHTLVETSPRKRLANFEYAAPEQRSRGKQVGYEADIFSLGLILNEMFTREVPHGTDYKTVKSIAADFAYLDPIISKMLAQSPSDRPRSIAEVKTLIAVHRNEFAALQKLSEIQKKVIKVGEIDNPLAFEPPKLIAFDWANGALTLTVDRPLNPAYIYALQTMPTGWLMGYEPQRFSFKPHGTTAVVPCPPSDQTVQQLINFFKTWLTQASQELKQSLENKARQDQYQREEELKRVREAEEARLKLLRNVQV